MQITGYQSTYTIGNTFDFTATACYNDESHNKDVTKACTITCDALDDDRQFTQVGTHKITISYLEDTKQISKEITVTVENPEPTIITPSETLQKAITTSVNEKAKGPGWISYSAFYHFDPSKGLDWDGTKEFTEILQNTVQEGGALSVMEGQLASGVERSIPGTFISDTFTVSNPVVYTSADDLTQFRATGEKVDTSKWITMREGEEVSAYRFYYVQMFEYDTEEQMASSLANDIVSEIVTSPFVMTNDEPGITRVYLKTQNCTKRQEKDIKGFYHRQYKEVIA